MRKAKQAGEMVFKMFKFQYEPVEKQLLKWCRANKRNDIIKMYKNADSITKIAMLDRTAQEMGL